MVDTNIDASAIDETPEMPIDIVKVEAPIDTKEVADARSALAGASQVVTELEASLEAFNAEARDLFSKGDFDAGTVAMMKRIEIQSPTDENVGKLPIARAQVEKLTKALRSAEFDALWEGVKGDMDVIRESIASLFTLDVAKRVAETGYKRVSFVVDGFDNTTGAPNVSIVKGSREGGASTSSTGERASRSSEWSKGDETLDSAIAVLQAHGIDHPAAKGFNGIMNGKSYAATPAGWVEGKVEYKKDASKLARDLGFAPVKVESEEPAADTDTPSEAPETPTEEVAPIA